MTLQYKVRLKPIHDATGLSPYMVAKQTGLAQNTVRKYVDNEEVVSEYLHTAIIVLARFYGVDWRDPAIVEVVESEDNPLVRTPDALPI